MNTLQAFESLSPLQSYSKKDLVLLAKRQAEELIDSGDVVQAYAFISKIEALLDTLKKEIKDSAILAVEKGDDRALSVGMKVQGKTTWYYDRDKTWLAMREQIIRHEDFLKSIQETTEVINKETGEVTIYTPAYKKVSDYIKTEF